jgi:hypothetical protein
MREPADAAGLGPAGLAGTGQASPEGLGGLDADGADLPRRIRQASLAPQLRDSPVDPLPAPVAEEAVAPAPEEARSTMTAIQQGWERGRSVFDVPPPPQPGAGNGEPSPDAYGPAGEPGAPGGPGSSEATATAPGTGGPGDVFGSGTAPVSAAAPAAESETAAWQADDESSDDGGSGG